MQRRRLKGHRILGYFRWFDLIPVLIQQRCGKILSRLIALVEFLCRNYFVEKGLRDRFPVL
jgi:hypothetical protein